MWHKKEKSFGYKQTDNMTLDRACITLSEIGFWENSSLLFVTFNSISNEIRHKYCKPFTALSG